MKVSKSWLAELVELDRPVEEVIKILPYKTISVSENTPEYFELDMKGYNRADLLSLKGVALEICSITDSKLKFQDTKDIIWQELKDDNPPKSLRTDLPSNEIEIENRQLCPFFTLTKIEGLKIGPSPKEWVEKLESSGMRSVNNITDITNLIMLEYGQPMHAFSAQIVKDEKIIVRGAKVGESIETLDQKVRELSVDDILITDEENILGIAGIMGGKMSEIPDNGKVDILLEAAIFNPKNIRKTSNRLHLKSEASKRFIHGLTKIRLLEALNAALNLYEQIGGKITKLTIPKLEYTNFNDFPIIDRIVDIPLRINKLNKLIGVTFDRSEVIQILKKIYCRVVSESRINDELTLRVRVPYYRLDLTIEEDLIEEVARIYGYENITAKSLEGEKPQKIDQSLFEFIKNIKNKLVDLGLTEVQTYSFYSNLTLNALNLNTNNLIKVANPISSETEYLRYDLWPNLVDAVQKNLNKFEDIAIFEIGKVYIPKLNEKPKEEFRLSITISNKSDKNILEVLSIVKKAVGENKLDYKKIENTESQKTEQLFHPQRDFELILNNQQIGHLAEIHPRFLYKYGIKQRVSVLELQLEKLVG